MAFLHKIRRESHLLFNGNVLEYVLGLNYYAKK